MPSCCENRVGEIRTSQSIWITKTLMLYEGAARRSYFFLYNQHTGNELLTEKEAALLDKKIAALEPRVHEAKQHYDTLVGQLAKLLETRYPERQEDAIKDRLYQAYRKSGKDIDFIVDFIENGPDEDY